MGPEDGHYAGGCLRRVGLRHVVARIIGADPEPLVQFGGGRSLFSGVPSLPKHLRLAGNIEVHLLAAGFERTPASSAIGVGGFFDQYACARSLRVRARTLLLVAYDTG